MQCPYCGGDSQVVDSRGTTEAVRRRRLCNACKRRFTTYERVTAPPIKVVKRNGRVEPFDTDKLLSCLRRVCRNRPAIDEITLRRVARNIEAQLVDSSARTIRSSDVASLVLARLADLDRLAYNRMAADYLDEAGHLRTDSRAGDEDATQLGLFEADDDGED